METKLQYIREQVIKANPSIKDLVFGCELHVGDSGVRRFFSGSNEEEEEWFFVELDQVGSEDQYYYREGYVKDLNKDVIIGREIRLADVILALSYKFGFVPSMRISELINGADRKMNWLFRQDNLELQSEECKEFIYNLLK